MWLFTDQGFYSAVRELKLEPYVGLISVRARLRGDLERLRTNYLPGATEISKTPDDTVADYSYRMWVDPVEFGLALSEIGSSVGYGNFKSRVLETLGAHRERPLHQVWSIMARLQKVRPYANASRWHWSDPDEQEEPLFGRYEVVSSEEAAELLQDGYIGGAPILEPPRRKRRGRRKR